MSKNEEDTVFDISELIRNSPKWKFWDRSHHIIVTCKHAGCDFSKKINLRYSSAVVGWGSMVLHKLELAMHASECEFAPKPKKATPKKTAKKAPVKKPVKKAAKKGK